MGKLPKKLHNEFQKLCNQYCKGTNIKTVSTYFKMGNFYTVRDLSLKYLKSLLVYMFKYVRCSSFYV